jgi:hypothetical protein
MVMDRFPSHLLAATLPASWKPHAVSIANGLNADIHHPGKTPIGSKQRRYHDLSPKA